MSADTPDCPGCPECDPGGFQSLLALCCDPNTDTLLKIESEGGKIFEIDASQLASLANMARWFTEAADVAINHATTKGGQQVSFHSGMAAWIRVPSGVKELQFWRDRFNEALEGT